MPRELINVGTEANDGTGETLRAAGQKINANFQEVYTLTEESATAIEAQGNAIAAFSNDLSTLDTSQAAQGEAIDLLTTASNNQGDALGALTTITGNLTNAIAAIDTDQDSQDAAITSLSTVNSEQAAAIVALLARPQGFTYDQQSEPLNPTAGQTWREGNGEWEWSGSLWLSTVRYKAGPPSVAFTSVSANGNNIGCTLPSRTPISDIWLDGVELIYRRSTGLVDSLNFWTVTIYPIRDDSVVFTAVPLTSLVINNEGTFWAALPLGIVHPNRFSLSSTGNVSGLIAVWNTTGTPGAFRAALSANYRLRRV
ncbi:MULTISPECIES: hypothetical protein [Cyanophyceae]|uniref:hypothetical protein n=1 Tax=Cyanophyceae TaxID=3028117 RepID=UPI001688C47A|nr:MULTISPECIES: hypothetical protein [Cyanophyceae]MBD1917170.1 hypothetical protein [Phormidium sp. FACHB-77]MBD2030701.1 hypothetical protein [Phormidium sp. FACHB-322]MBD2050191.1 hypothetical protein [Leptolyngbya sp. FACHB-60]